MRTLDPIALRLASLAALVGVACATTPPVAAGPAAFEGRYEDLTQQDWLLALTLDADGGATLEYTWWPAGGREGALRRVQGTWQQQGSQLVVRYADVTDTFDYRERFEVSGAGGAKPALVAVEPVHQRSVVGVSTLWRVEAPAPALD